VIHVHVDADDLWIYAAEYGVPASEVVDSVYGDALPRFLELFAEAGAKATFFVVGRDLQRAEARAFCRDAVAQGHEIANHSFSHAVAFHRLAPAEKEREILAADAAIGEATGTRPVGFRAPGYYLDGAVVDVLARNDYLYDTSILPSYVQPLMKLYIRRAAGNAIDKQFGTPRSPFATQRPRRIVAADGRFLFELPVSVLPVLRLPIHSTFSFQLPPLARRLTNATFARRRSGVMLFHAVDSVGAVAHETLRSRVLPLRLTHERRIASIREALAATAGRSTCTTREYFEELDPGAVPWSRILRFA
jgi:peptidoglycan/xylan/chitin deacetylase (PgdA/CDA1 family)